MLVKLCYTCMCFLCNSRFKSSLELMLCVIDISTLNKTYLIWFEVILKSRTLSRTSDTTETRNPCVIKVILLTCFTYIDIFKFKSLILTYDTDKNFCFYAEVNYWDFVRNDNSNKRMIARLNETRFGPKKSRPQYISAQKISTLFDEIAR